MSVAVRKDTQTPLGRMRCIASDRALLGVYFEAHDSMPPEAEHCRGGHDILDRAIAELSAYFEGRARSFSTPLAMGGTEFQKRVWSALGDIPYGETRSYGQLARAIGKPNAVRAVGTANGKNPLSIFVPCHRVIGADGRLTGYAGGMANKRWLLGHERAVTAGGVV